MSIYIKALQNTVLKKTPYKQASELSRDNYIEVEIDREYRVTHANPKIVNGHQQVVLDYNAGTWWLFMDHWEGLLPKEGLKLKKKFESCVLTAYPDPGTGGEPWTIGWGNTFYENGTKVKRGDKITQERADELLFHVTQNHFLKILSLTIPNWSNFNDLMRGALLSFAYNCGAKFYGNRGYSSITKVLNVKEYGLMRNAFMLYVNPGTRVETGLRRRRTEEADLWEHGLKAYTDRREKLDVPSVIDDSGKNLDVPYYSQRDNKYSPSKTCNVTSVAMVLKYLGVDIDNDSRLQDEDELYLKMVKEYGADSIYWHDRLSQLMRSYRVNTRFTTEGNVVQVIDSINQGFPVIYSGKFTSSGHIIVIRGYDKNGFFCNDPWGTYDPNTGKYINTNGENVHYSYATIRRLSYSGTAGWVHLISK